MGGEWKMRTAVESSIERLASPITASPGRSSAELRPEPARAEIRRRVEELGEWFHNLNLHGVETAPGHFLGDFPNVKWKHIAPALPENLSGATVLDIGCNGGF